MKKIPLILALCLSFLFLNSRLALAETATEYLHLGNVSSKEDKYPNAILNYTKAIESDPNFAKAYYNRGYTYIKMRKYKMAIDDLNKAVEIRPKYAAAYHVRGIAYFSKKKYKQAVLDYSKAIELYPENLRFYQSRMSAYFKLNDTDKVWKDIIEIQKLGGTVNPSIMNMLKDRKYRDQ